MWSTMERSPFYKNFFLLEPSFHFITKYSIIYLLIRNWVDACICLLGRFDVYHFYNLLLSWTIIEKKKIWCAWVFSDNNVCDRKTTQNFRLNDFHDKCIKFAMGHLVRSFVIIISKMKITFSFLRLTSLQFFWTPHQ